MSKIVDEIKDAVKKGEEIVKEAVEKVEEFVEETVEAVEEKISGKDLEEKAEKESEHSAEEEEAKAKTASKEDLEDRKKKLLEKAAKLKEKVSSEASSEDLKEQVKAKKKSDMLVPLEEYVKDAIYLGTRVVTPDMKQFIYRRRADGLAIFNTDTIDEKLKEGLEFLTKYNPEDIILVCKRQAGWKAAEMFGKLTGIKVFTRKYPAGILTNTALPNFMENELTIITDHWLDRNAVSDTVKVKKDILMICDTNNFSKHATHYIIGNNKSARSLGLIFYLFAREYCKAKGIDTSEMPDIDWWTGEISDDKKGASFGV